MRVVLCGAGHIGVVHAANLAASDRVTELVVADLDTARAGELAAGIGARAATPEAAHSPHGPGSSPCAKAACRPDGISGAGTPAEAGSDAGAVARDPPPPPDPDPELKVLASPGSPDGHHGLWTRGACWRTIRRLCPGADCSLPARSTAVTVTR